MVNLKNKSIVVTGGTKGIGIEITKSFLKQNAKVFVLARQKPKRIIQAKGNKAVFIECDIRNIDSVDQAVKKIKGLSKSIDVLVAGDFIDARNTVIELAADVGLTGWHAGPLCNSVAAEALTSILIAINKKHSLAHSGIKITGH